MSRGWQLLLAAHDEKVVASVEVIRVSSITICTTCQSRCPLPSDSDGHVPERRPQRRAASLIRLRLSSERAAPRSFHLKIVQKPQHACYAQQRAAAAPDAPVRCTAAWRGCQPRKIFTNNHESPYQRSETSTLDILYLFVYSTRRTKLVRNRRGAGLGTVQLGYVHARRHARHWPCHDAQSRIRS